MILFVSFLVVGCMTALGWYLMRDLFSPYVIVPGVWFAILLLSYLTQPEFFPIIHDFPVAMVLWCGFFLIAAYLVYALLPEERGLLTLKPSMVENVTPSRKVINAYMVISLLAMPYMLYALVRYGIERGETNLFLYIRLSSVETDFDKPEFGLAIYLIPIVPVLLILWLCEGALVQDLGCSCGYRIGTYYYVEDYFLCYGDNDPVHTVSPRQGEGGDDGCRICLVRRFQRVVPAYAFFRERR